MDKRFKVFHIRYDVYPDLEWMLKEKVFEYERKHNLIAVDFSVMYDKENDKYPQIRDAAVVVAFEDNTQNLTSCTRFKSFRINYKMYSEFEALLRLKIISFEEEFVLSRYGIVGFGILSDSENEKNDNEWTAIVLVMFKEETALYACEREKIAKMSEKDINAYKTELADPDKSYNPEEVVDIYSKGLWDEVYLSNFCETDFVFDDVQIKSLEGFLQSLKTKDEQKQKLICSLIGKDAKTVGSFLTEYDGTHLYWKGKPIDRFSEEYHALLRRVYLARFEHDANFRQALEYTKNKKLIHTVGNSDPQKTILTDAEFINLLSELHEMI